MRSYSPKNSIRFMDFITFYKVVLFSYIFVIILLSMIPVVTHLLLHKCYVTENHQWKCTGHNMQGFDAININLFVNKTRQ